MAKLLSLEDIQTRKHQLSARFSVDGYSFSTSYWFDTVDFNTLEERFGRAFMTRINFHIAAFEINKICSLRPEVIDWGDYSYLVDKAFWELWTTIFRNVWAQWRYENDDPDYFGPALGGEFADNTGSSIERRNLHPKTLAFFGGGKDSLVAAKLLEDIENPYDSLVYASSIYGNLDKQHQIISKLLYFCNPEQQHRQWIFDDFLDSPVVALGPESRSKTLTAAETPSSIFSSLPIALANDISEICLAHEKSSDTGQVIWERTGEDVNHQWGKSYEAEKLINGYIQNKLLADFRYYSILKPIHDVLIFNLLRDSEDIVRYTQSCNISKPWCRRCPKCLYVWVNYMAYLDVGLVDSIFGENLGSVPENLPIFRDLLGFTDQLPFECIGQFNETRLAFELCIAKGVRGDAFDMYRKEDIPFNLEKILEKHLGIYVQECEIPQRIQSEIVDKLNDTAKSAREYIQGILHV